MSEIAPPSPTPPPAAQNAVARVTVTQAPPGLADLPLGAKLDVIVSEIVDAAQIKVSSRLGDIGLRLPAQTSLTPGQALIVNLLGSGTPPRVNLTTPDGRALLAGTAQGNAAQGSASPGAAATARQGLQGGVQAGGVQPTVQIKPGAIVTANLLRPLSVNGALVVQPGGTGAQAATGNAATQTGAQPGVPSGTPSAGQAGAQTGAQTGAQVGTQSGLQAGAATRTGPGLSGPASGGGASSGAQTATARGGGVTVFPAGSGLALRVVTVNVPAQTPQSLTPPAADGQISLAPGAQLAGVVSGRQGVGHTVVQTNAGPVSLPTLEALPPGTQIRFEVVSLNAPTTGNAQHGHMHAGAAPLFDGQWFTFDEALDVLQEAAPGAHQHILQAAMPRADTQLATNVLFFLSALRGGDLKGWLGDGPVRILDRIRPDIAGRLRTDMTQMTRSFEDPLSGEWRLQAVPFLHGAEIDRVQFLVRDQDGEDGDNDDGKGGTRFVVDLNLTRLGHLQIDGLVGEKNKRLDLVLRTDEPLQPHMRDDIRGLYRDALELTGLEGSVGFQAAPGNFVEIPKRAPSGTETGVTA